MVQYKLYYFNSKGRAELVRLVFAAAGQEYEDVRFEREQWPEHKDKAPFGQCPFIEVYEGDKKEFALSQSVSIARYLSRKFGLAGKGDNEQAQVDMYGDQISDFLNEMVKLFYEKDEEKKALIQKRLAEEVIPNYLAGFERKVSQSGSGFLVSSGLTWADLYLVSVIEWLGAKKDETLNHFAGLKALDKTVREHPHVSAWLAKRPVTEY